MKQFLYFNLITVEGMIYFTMSYKDECMVAYVQNTVICHVHMHSAKYAKSPIHHKSDMI